MPKTLAALPSNQYATLLSLVFGQLEERPRLFAVASARAETSACAAPAVVLLLSGWVDFHLTERRTDGRDADADADARGARVGRRGELAQGRLTNSRRVSRGAAVLNWGNVWNIEAMAEV